MAIARGRRPEVEDNGAFMSLLVTTAIAGGIWLAMGVARGFAPVTTRALLWFAGAGVLTAFVGRVAFYATVERLGAMRAVDAATPEPVLRGRDGHDETDELFLILEGEFEMAFRDRTISVGPGELLVVPRGVEHRPAARKGVCKLLLIDPDGTPNTGDTETATHAVEL